MVDEFSVRQLQTQASKKIETSSNSAVKPALTRLLDGLPEGPFTPGELETELDA